MSGGVGEDDDERQGRCRWDATEEVLVAEEMEEDVLEGARKVVVWELAEPGVWGREEAAVAVAVATSAA